jgi:copper(I)-binding protein
MTKRTLELLLAAIAACALPAVTGAADSLRIVDAWARATPPGAATGAAYCKIVNGAEADRMIGARSAAARAVEVHTTTTASNGVVEMHAVEELAVAAGGAVEFAAGGMHLMLVGLAAPLAAGATIELTFVFEKAGEITVAVPVIDARAPAPAATTHEQHAH